MLRVRLAAVAAAVLALVVPTSAHAATLPVPYTFLTSAVLAGLQPNADAPGTNDWTCKPTAAHPRPVVLVHGLMGNRATNWQTYGPLLKNNGYCVFALTYGVNELEPVPAFGGLNPIEQSAAELKVFIARVLAATGAKQVDIVGHSEGTVMPNYYAKFLGGGPTIKRYVAIAPLWHGTNPAGLATLYTAGTPFGVSPAVAKALQPFFASGPQLLTGSAFWQKMRTGGTPAVPGIEYTNIITKYDELVQPYTSGIEPGMRNVVVQDLCRLDYAEHFQIVADPVAAQVVLNTLDPEHPKPVPCRLVLPFVGGL
jgi:triacylglycerol lipase